MSSRPLVALCATFVLAFSAAGCGGDDETPVVSPGATPNLGNGDATPDLGTTPSTPEAPEATGSTPDSTAEETPNPGEPTRPDDTADLIPQVAEANTDLTNLTTALGAADLSGTLGGAGPFTVFAPNNDAFAKLGTKLDALLQPAAKAELANILRYHVVEGDLRISKLRDGQLLTTIQGTRLRVSRTGSQVSIGNSLGQAKVVSPNVDAGNGTIHVIDSVLTPKSPTG